MNEKKAKRLLESALTKIVKSKNFNSDCVLTSEESEVIHEVLYGTSIRVAKIMESNNV